MKNILVALSFLLSVSAEVSFAQSEQNQNIKRKLPNSSPGKFIELNEQEIRDVLLKEQNGKMAYDNGYGVGTIKRARSSSVDALGIYKTTNYTHTVTKVGPLTEVKLEFPEVVAKALSNSFVLKTCYSLNSHEMKLCDQAQATFSFQDDAKSSETQLSERCYVSAKAQKNAVVERSQGLYKWNGKYWNAHKTVITSKGTIECSGNSVYGEGIMKVFRISSFRPESLAFPYKESPHGPEFYNFVETSVDGENIYRFRHELLGLEEPDYVKEYIKRNSKNQ